MANEWRLPREHDLIPLNRGEEHYNIVLESAVAQHAMVRTAEGLAAALTTNEYCQCDPLRPRLQEVLLFSDSTCCLSGGGKKQTPELF